MLNRANLSLEQAPPISVPFRFFLTAPLFGILAALLLLYYGPEALTSRWAPVTLALTHLITLGFLGMIMCGAMMQMLPVLAGSPVPAVAPVSTAVHLLLTAGTLALASGFLFSSTLLLHLALCALGIGFLVFIIAVAIALKRIQVASSTITGMRLALASLAITVILGLTIGSILAGILSLPLLLPLTDIHLGWGLLGWVGLLMVGVSYQVVPMFQLTPEYPGWLSRFLAWALFAALSIWALLYLAGGHGHLHPMVPDLWVLAPMAGYALFAGATLSLQWRRRRRVSDITLLFWRTGMIAIFGCLAVWLAGFIPGIREQLAFPMLMGGVLLVGAAISVTNGMLYKIVPFLAWFHLQNRQLALGLVGQVKIPNMKELLPDPPTRRQFLAHLATLALTLPAIFWPNLFARPAGLALGISCAMLWYNLFQATRCYRQVNARLSVSPTSG
jgi:hypothetical protein